MTGAQPVANLIMPYADPEYMDPQDRSDILAAMSWLRTNPGRWGLIGSRHYGSVLGCQPMTARRAGMLATERVNKATGAILYYASCPTPDGEGNQKLNDCIAATRWARPHYPEDLPVLERDKTWNDKLMWEAIQTARAWLFVDPVEVEETPLQLAA